MQYTPIIGLEVHVQLLTQTKIFCGCLNRFNPNEPNTQTCPVCLGLPGSLPVLNRRAFRLSLITALALNCEIAEVTKWDRKQYFYPDLPKGYQISQFDLPFSRNGHVFVTTAEGAQRRVRINRAHLEEDAGKNLHDESGRRGESKVDLNRAGTPLLEIVSEPDLRSAIECRNYLEELHLLLTYLEVSDCNMQEGSLRCDANVNLHIAQEGGDPIATPIVEIKNLNTFRGVEAAVDYEIQRQQEEFLKTGRKLGDPGVLKETRGWNADRGVSFAQRGKEEASDYRYFPDPDLVPVTVSRETIEALRQEQCELPAVRRTRFIESLGLSAYDADVITRRGRRFADYFEATATLCGDAKQAANWVTQDVLREMNERSVEIDTFPLSSTTLGTLLKEVVVGSITVKSARELFATLLKRIDEGELATAAEAATETADLAKSAVDIAGLIDELGLRAVTGGNELEAAIEAVIVAHPAAVADFQSGKQQALGPLIGKIVKEIKGADAKAVREQIIARLSR